MEKPFRLLDLPANIRDQIYYEILCTWPEENQNAVNPTEVAVMAGNSRIAILCTSRDVYFEAGAVMLRGNQFIRISIKGHQPLQVLFIPSQVPVVNMNQKFITKFGSFVMTHSIDFANDPAPLKSQFEVMIIRRDLDRFVQALGKADLSSPNFTATSKHRVTIHNPFLGTGAQDFWTKENKVRAHTKLSNEKPCSSSPNCICRNVYLHHIGSSFMVSKTSKSTAISKKM
jgi:hypothetical protein